MLSWLAVLAAAGGAFLAFGGTLASSMSIPGTETERVTERLADALPQLGGVTGTVVFQRDGDGAFTEAQREAIGELLESIERIDGVASVVDPFAADAERAAREAELSDGAVQLDAARAQLAAGQAQLDAAIEQARAAGAYDLVADQFEAQQAEIDAGLAEIAAQEAQLADGQTLLAAAAALRTVSDDGRTAFGAIVFEDDLFTLSPETKGEVAAALSSAGIDGVSVDYSTEIAGTLAGLMGPGEIAGVVIAALVLLVMLRAILPALLPLVSSLVGVGIGVAGSLAFSSVVDMSSVTPALGVMLGLAVGIDYALFIVNRHRRQLALGMRIDESIALANGTSGSAVVFAGATVVIALLALAVTGIPFLTVMGVVGAVCVLVAVLLAVSLTPALLALVGPRVLSRRVRARIERVASAEGAAHAAAGEPPLRPLRTPRAVAGMLVAVVALLALAAPALSMRLGLPDGSSEPVDSTQHRAYEAIAEEFGAGQNGALLLVAEADEPVAEDDVLAEQADIVELLMAQDDVAAVAPIGVSGERDVLAFQVVPVDGPASERTEALVHELRALEPAPGFAFGVAGQASGNIDISAKLAGALPIYLAVIVGLSLVILVVVFRSLVVPLIATGGFVLSLFAALGAVTAVYQWGWLGTVFGVHDPGPVLNFAPILLVGVLFGLAMDYQLFLVSGMREAYVHGMPARMAVSAGLRNGRAVVTAAAIIMAAVFGGFIYSHLAMIRPIGFGLALGVLFDAFVVRMLIVPGLMHVLGDRAWWIPKWLDRVLPRADVEGAALERRAPTADEPAREFAGR